MSCNPFARRPRGAALLLAICCSILVTACGAAEPPAAAPKIGKLPHLTFDAKNKQVRVEADALAVDAPLEFFCVLTNTSEHESVLRSNVKPSDLHTALLAIGLKPGRPVSFSETTHKWSPPQGPPLQVHVEWQDKDGKTVSVPAYRLMRNTKSKKEMPILTWVFVGSRTMEDGSYAADTTGYIISVVNFDLTVIDIPELKTSNNETLEWERNPDLAPPGGTKVTMVIEPAGNKAAAGSPEPVNAAPAAPEAPATTEAVPAPATSGADEALSDVHLDEKRAKALQEYWARKVNPHAAALREAAQAHYDVITALRKEQQRLIDEADRLQRAIDKLEQEYQQMTVPRPSGAAVPEPATEPKAPAAPRDEPGPFGAQ
jgi:hypothetical protein